MENAFLNIDFFSSTVLFPLSSLSLFYSVKKKIDIESCVKQSMTGIIFNWNLNWNIFCLQEFHISLQLRLYPLLHSTFSVSYSQAWEFVVWSTQIKRFSVDLTRAHSDEKARIECGKPQGNSSCTIACEECTKVRFAISGRACVNSANVELFAKTLPFGKRIFALMNRQKFKKSRERRIPEGILSFFF